MGSIIFHSSEVGRIPEPVGSKTSLATTKQLGSTFIVYSPCMCDLNKGGVPAPGAPVLPTPLHGNTSVIQ